MQFYSWWRSDEGEKHKHDLLAALVPSNSPQILGTAYPDERFSILVRDVINNRSITVVVFFNEFGLFVGLMDFLKTPKTALLRK